MTLDTTRVSKQPHKGNTGVFALGDGRWAYVIDGLVRFVVASEEECRTRTRNSGYDA